MKRNALLRMLFILILFFSATAAVLRGQQARTVQPAVNKVSDQSQRIVEAYGNLPLSFEANVGQVNSQAKFLSRGQGYTLFLTRRGEAVLALRKPVPKRDPLRPAALVSMPATPSPDAAGPPAVVRIKLVGANAKPRAEALGGLAGKANYFIGNDPKKWRTNVPLFAKVKYRHIYPGVDLVYYGNQRQLESDFIVAPGVNPRSIALNFSGVDKMSVDAHGELVLKIKGGEVRLGKPHIYQEVDGTQREISGGYALNWGHEVSFEVAAYDNSRSLVIDPALFYSTYLGGSGFDRANGIAVDATGNAYVTGSADSTNFPTTMGAFQPSGCGAYVTKLNPTGSGLVYSTYIGNANCPGAPVGEAVAVDVAGNAYVTGQVNSSNFPTTAGAFQTSYGGNGDVFVTKLNPAGSGLVYSTYLGGNGGDIGRSIAVDAAGNAYVTGDTGSSAAQSGTNFPTTPGAFQPNIAGAPGFQQDAFVTKLNPAGTGLLYSTYLGGSGIENSFGIAVDMGGNAYVTGVTGSTDFPTTGGAFQSSPSGTPTAYVSKLNPLGTGLVYSTYLGGGTSSGPGLLPDFGLAIAVDTAGNAFVTGGTSSAIFPTTPGAFQPSLAGCQDAFVTKLNPAGSGLVYSTYLGGNGCPPGSGEGFGANADAGFGIAVDAGGNAYVTGSTNATDFPTTTDAFQPVNQGGFDAFVTKLNPTGSGLLYSSYLGGSNDDFAKGIGLDALPNPDAYLAGWTSSTNFLTTTGAFQTTYGGGIYDAFVAKITGFPATADAAITATGVTFSATEGQSFAGTVANFHDPDPKSTPAEYNATIDWGDGSSSAGLIKQTGISPKGNDFAVIGTHTYTEEGTYTVTVTITDVDTPKNTTTPTSTASVRDAALHSSCAVAPASTQSFSGPTATFTDDNQFATTADFSATINWGDSTTSSGTISGGPGAGPYTVRGNHTYSTTGTFTISTLIRDDGGAKTAATCQVIVFAFPTATGAFVIGDLADPLPIVGDSVTWWSSQWAQLNPMSGGPAPASMKGFAGFEDNPLGTPRTCGSSWTTDTGNATPPPPSVPAFMGVLVSSRITQNGSVISGDIKQVVVVRNNPGYAPDPGHTGSGTIVAIVCKLP